MAINDKKVMTYDEYKKLIEAYKEQNPVKYEAKKEELEAKLEALKPASAPKEDAPAEEDKPAKKTTKKK